MLRVLPHSPILVVLYCSFSIFVVGFKLFLYLILFNSRKVGFPGTGLSFSAVVHGQRYEHVLSPVAWSSEKLPLSLLYRPSKALIIHWRLKCSNLHKKTYADFRNFGFAGTGVNFRAIGLG